MTPDAELIELWRRGDNEAGAELFERHYESIARFFRNKVGSSAHDDLVQQVFLKCAESLHRLRGASSFRTYLFAIAHRTLVDHFRKLVRRSKREAIGVDFDVDSVEELSVSRPSPELNAMNKQQRRLLLEGLRRIPLNYQVALELHYWEELTVAQVSEVVGVPLGTAKTRLRDGRKALESALRAIATSVEHLQSTLDDLEAWAARTRAQAL